MSDDRLEPLQLNICKQSYLLARKLYLKTCADEIKELIERCKTPTSEMEAAAVAAYPKTEWDDEIDPFEVIEQASGQLLKLANSIEKAADRRAPRTVLELQTDWQHVMHSFDVEIKRVINFVGGFPPAVETELAQNYQNALYRFYKYEHALKIPGVSGDEGLGLERDKPGA